MVPTITCNHETQLIIKSGTKYAIEIEKGATDIHTLEHS